MRLWAYREVADLDAEPRPIHVPSSFSDRGSLVHRLVDFPWVVVRLGCRYCERRGSYRLARLAAKFGAEIDLDTLLDKLARDCPWRRDPGERHPAKYDPKCGACFRDLDGAPPPSDLPPGAMGLRVVRGGRG